MLKVIIDDEEVFLRGEPWYFSHDLLFFPRQKVFLMGECCKYYDALSENGLTEWIPEGLIFTALPLYGDREIDTLRIVLDKSHQDGMGRVRYEIKRALGL